jgi:hypothetical protein
MIENWRAQPKKGIIELLLEALLRKMGILPW